MLQRTESTLTTPDAAIALPATGPAATDVRAPAFLSDLSELTKPRITRLVTITAAVGFAMGAMTLGRISTDLVWIAAITMLGTALCSSGASALNEWIERERDGRMRRTADRPIPAGRVEARLGLIIGLALCAVGVALLGALVNWASAAVAGATIFSYVWIYTPLKPFTTIATVIGAVPGALPPLIGWTAAFGSVARSSEGPLPWHGLDHPGGWAIFALMFVWQIPHFLAIAWRHREDYARGGHRVLPVVDPSGVRTVHATLVWTAAMIPASLGAIWAMPQLLDWPYAAVALCLGLWFFRAAWRFARSRADGDAKRLFIVSVIYLPLVMGAMVADAALIP